MKEQVTKLLHWSEKYTKTDMVYLAGGGFWLFVGHGVQVLSGIVLAVAFANLIPKETYGVYQFIMSIAAILSAFTLSGMGSAITKFVAQGSGGALRYGFRSQLYWSILIPIMATAVSIYYYINGNDTLSLALLIVGALTPFIQSFGLYDSYLIGKEHFKEKTMLGLWRKPLPLVALLLTLFLTDSPLILIFVYFASHTISLGLLYVLIVQKYKLPFIPEPEMKRYSKHLSVMKIFTTFANTMDKVLIFHFLGAAPVAAFVLAQFPTTHLRNLFGLLRTLSFSKITKRPFPELQESLPRKLFLLFSFTLGVVVLYIFIAPVLFTTLLPAYPESILYSQILALAVLTTPKSLIMQTFIAHQKTKEQYFIRIIFPFLRLLLLLPLILFYGIYGAIAAVVISEFMIAGIQGFLFFKKPRKATL